MSVKAAHTNRSPALRRGFDRGALHETAAASRHDESGVVGQRPNVLRVGVELPGRR